MEPNLTMQVVGFVWFLGSWALLTAVLEGGRGPDAGSVLAVLRERRDAGAQPRAAAAKVALGYNVCLDAVVDAVALLAACGVDPAAGSLAADVSSIDSLGELGAVFASHFSRAAAGERAVGDEGTFHALEAGLRHDSLRKKKKLLLGGNAAIMAAILAEDWGFAQVHLGGQVGGEIAKLLPSSIQTVALDAGSKVGHIAVRNDETHVIMEYEKGARWGPSTAQRANRFIVSRDLSNAVVASLEPLNALVKEDGDFDLLVVAGFHMLDAMPHAFRVHRMREIRASLAAIPARTRVHLELASIGHASLLGLIVTEALGHVQSLGLNEQELAALHTAMGGAASEASAVSRVAPDLTAAAAVMLRILRKTPTLSRIHFHAFSVHIIAVSDAGLRAWPNSAAAVAAGSIKASERACNATTFAVGDLAPATIPLATWTQQGVHFFQAPVLACNNVVQTVGLGDAISATALAFQA